MKKTVLVLSAAVALSVLTAPVALAQNTGPDTNACEKARIAEGEALDLVRDAEKARNQFRDAARDGVEGVGNPGTDKEKGISERERNTLDGLNGTLERLQKDLEKAVDKRDEKCAEPEPTPTPTPAPTPTPTPSPAPEEDLDCADFPLSSGRTAQQVLDETPGEDPHGLDADGDRRACEPGQDTAPDGSDVADNDNDVVTPSGGVATGVGPA